MSQDISYAKMLGIKVSLLILLSIFFWVSLGEFFSLALAKSDILPMTSEDNEKMTWNLVSDQLRTLQNNSIIEAEGGVVLTRGNDVLKADFARYFVDTNWVYLNGNVFVRMGKDDIHAESGEFDLKSKTGWLSNGHIFMDGPHIYLSGSRILKHWGDRYTFNEAKITTCDGSVPTWSFKADQAVVEIDGYAQLFHSTVNIKDQGIFYTPFMILPAKTTRQSGLLAPDYGISNRRGLFYTQPYYYVIDDSRDMTFYGGWMEKIGPQFGVEYRSHTFANQKTWLTVSGIYDKNTIHLGEENGVYGSDNIARTNQDRFWIRGMSDGFLGVSTWRYRTNIDYVSDQDYLREFNNGPLGFNKSRDSLAKFFGRDLQEDDQNRVSTLMISNDWDRIGIVASVRYEQDPALEHGNIRKRSQDEVVQQLPQFDAFLYKGRILEDFPLEIEAQFQNGYMYRAEGTTGWRSEFYPQLSLPLNMRYGSLIASAGLRQTWYNTNRTDYTSPLAPYNPSPKNPSQTGESRTMVDFDIQGYTETSRVWDLVGKNFDPYSENAVGHTTWTAFRHQLQPRIRYRRTPSVDQDNNPFYTMNDRILPTNELTYSLTNILTRKGTVVTETGTDDQKEYQANTTYQDILRWQIETGYDFEEEQRKKHTEEYSNKPFMDIFSEIDFYPFSWLTYTSKIYLSSYTGSLTRTDQDVTLTYAPWISWTTGISYRDKFYDYRRKFQYDDWNDVLLSSPLRLLHNKISFNPTSEWSLYIDDNRNMREGGNGKPYDQTINISYTGQCYRFVGTYRYDGYDQSYTVMIELPGIFD